MRRNKFRKGKRIFFAEMSRQAIDNKLRYLHELIYPLFASHISMMLTIDSCTICKLRKQIQIIKKYSIFRRYIFTKIEVCLHKQTTPLNPSSRSH